MGIYLNYGIDFFYIIYYELYNLIGWQYFIRKIFCILFVLCCIWFSFEVYFYEVIIFFIDFFVF